MTISTPTVWYTMAGHMRPGSPLAFIIVPNHTSGELLTGVRFKITTLDGSVAYYTFERTGLNLSSSTQYEEFLTLSTWIPQNQDIRGYAQTQGPGGVWSQWYGAGPVFRSVNTPPSVLGSISPSGSYTTPTTNLSISARVRFTDPDGDPVRAMQIYLEKLVGGTYTLVSNKLYEFDPIVGKSTSSDIIFTLPSVTEGSYRWKIAARDVADPTTFGPSSAYTSFTVTKTTTTTTPPPSGGGGSGTPPPSTGAPTEDTSFSFVPSGTIPASGANFVFSGSARFKDADSSQLTGYEAVIEAYNSGSWNQVWTNTASLAVSPGVAFSISGPSLVTGTNYRWKVRVKDNTSPTPLWSNWSNARTFTASTAAGPNVAPTATASSPGAGATGVSLTPTFIGNFSDSGATNNTFSKFQIVITPAAGGSPVSQETYYTTDAEKSSKSFSRVYAGTKLNYSTAYNWKLMVWDNGNLSSAYTSDRLFTTMPPPAPEVPGDLSPVGNISTQTPTFVGSYISPVGAAISKIRVQVYTNSIGTVQLWDSGNVNPVTEGNLHSLTYNGPAFNPDQSLWWKMSFTDVNNQTSAPTALTFIKMTSIPSAPVNLWPRNSTTDVWPLLVNPVFGGDHIAASNSNCKAAEVKILSPSVVNLSITGINTKRFHIPFTSGITFTEGMTVTWQARSQAEDSGFWSPWSTTQSFVFNRSPGAPTTVAPSDTAKLATITPTLDWTYVNSDINLGTFVPNGRIQAFSVIELRSGTSSAGALLTGYPRPSAQFYYDFTTALDSGWTQQAGIWTSSGGTLTVSNTPNAILHRNAFSSSGFFACYVKHLFSTKTGLIFRRTDAMSYWLVMLDGEFLHLYKVMGGANGAPVKSYNMDAANNQYQHVMIGMIGPQITIYLNGSPVITGVTDRYNSNGTQHGVYVNGNSSAGFKDMWFATQRAQDSEYTVPTGTLALEQNYFWRVRSHDGFTLGSYN